MTTTRKQYLDFLRTIAIIAVVIVHATARCIRPLDYVDLNYRVGRVLIAAGQWAVPIFVMICGSLFLSPERDIPVTKPITRNLPRIAAAYLFWSCIYTLIFSTIPHFEVFSRAGMRNTLAGTLKGGSSHLWYLWMLSGLYLLTPVLRNCVKNATAELMCYFLAICFLMTSILPLARNIPVVEEIFGADLDILNSAFFGGYVFYFVLGSWLDTVKLQARTITCLYAAGIAGLLISCGGVFCDPVPDSALGGGISDNLSPCVVLTSAALFVAVKNRSAAKASPVLTILSKYSFGLYLSHNLFLDTIGVRLVSQLVPQVPPLLVAAALIPCTLLFGITLTALIRCLKPVGHYIT